MATGPRSPEAPRLIAPRACKPSSVLHRHLRPDFDGGSEPDARRGAAISLGPPLPMGSSGLPAPAPYREARTRPSVAPLSGGTAFQSGAAFHATNKNCVTLHAVGFSMPRLSPTGRCALTAPFHPYLILVAPLRAPLDVTAFQSGDIRSRCHQRHHQAIGGSFSVALSRARVSAISPGRVGVTHHRVHIVLGLSSDETLRSRRRPPARGWPVTL